MYTISVVNQKGGVGKTTSCINIAAAFAAVNKKVLVVDLDPQGNSSTGLGIIKNRRSVGIYQVLSNQAPAEDAILQTKIKNLDIVTATVDLAASELELVSAMNREYRLKLFLIDKLRDKYDFIFIDCPPSLGLLTINALTASNKILIPMQCEFYSLEGLSQLLKTVQLVKANLNSELDILGVLLTMYDGRNNLSGQVSREVRKYLGKKLFATTIPRNVRVSEAPSHGLPALVYDHNCRGSRAYIKLAKEILAKILEEELAIKNSRFTRSRAKKIAA